MPAEWEPHTATWMSWPHANGNSFPGSYDRVLPDYAAFARAVAESEPLCLCVRSAKEEAAAKKLLGAAAKNTTFHHIVTNEPWCRDHGPIFLRKKNPAKLAALDFGFNAWGWKLTPCDDDAEAAKQIATAAGACIYNKRDFILEGGAVETNGAGTLLTTESCLLNPNRNPQHNRAYIEKMLKDCLGVKKVLWLGDGIVGDDTDGHIDDLTRFVSEDTVVTAIEEDEKNPNYVPLQANFERLKGMSLANGKPLNIATLPMPPLKVRDGQPLPASYANFYIANKVVLLPTYGGATDAWASTILQTVFPDRQIVGIDCRELIWGLGAFHCLTQQQPAV